MTSMYDFNQACQQILADLPANVAHLPRSIVRDLVSDLGRQYPPTMAHWLDHSIDAIIDMALT